RSMEAARDALREPLLAIAADQRLERALIGGFDQLRGGWTGGSHAHVQRPFRLERKAARRILQLRRAHSEVQHESIDGKKMLAPQDVLQLREIPLHGAKALAEARQSTAGSIHRARIAIDANHRRSRLEQRFGMSTAAQRSV